MIGCKELEEFFMATLIHDAALESRLQQERAALGADRYDEVWEGVYVMAPMPNHEHQRLVGRFTRVLDEIVTDGQRGDVVPGVNVSDRVENWEENYRVPDVAVFLNDTKAVNHDTFWYGGPDFAVEITSPNDQSREKLAFYGVVGTRELLIVDRGLWQLELFRLIGGRLESSDAVTPAQNNSIESGVLSIEFGFQLVDNQPRIHVRHIETDRNWTL